VPSGPVGTGVTDTDIASRGVWAVNELPDGIISVCIPVNMESWADDYQCIAAIEAISLLPKYELSLSHQPWNTDLRLPERKTASAQYFAGIAHALRYLGSEPSRNFTGSFGKGYDHIVHVVLENLNIPFFLIKGNNKNPLQFLSKSAWGKDVDITRMRLAALIRRAAKNIVPYDLHSHIRSSQSLRGHGIRNGLPWNKEGIISAEENRVIRSMFSNCESAYKELCEIIDDQKCTIESLRGIPKKIEELSKSLRPADELVDKMVHQRFLALNRGLTGKRLKDAQKQTIELRVQNMDPFERSTVFHPLFIRGRKFNTSEVIREACERGHEEAIEELKTNIKLFCDAEEVSILRNLAAAWFSNNLLANF